MTRSCPVCGKTVDIQIDSKGRIVLFNKEGNYHSCAEDGDLKKDETYLGELYIDGEWEASPDY